MSETILSIRETLDRAIGSQVPSSHRHLLDRAVEAVQEREFDITDRAVAAAESAGARGQARSIVESTGLTFRPEPEPETAASDGDRPVMEAVSNLLTGIRNVLDEFEGSVRGH